MDVSIHRDPEDASAAAADCLATWLEIPAVRTVMVAGGRSPLGLYRHIDERGLDLREWRRLLPDQRRSDTSFVQLTDDEFAAGLRRIDADIAAGRTRPRAALDVLVLR